MTLSHMATMGVKGLTD